MAVSSLIGSLSKEKNVSLCIYAGKFSEKFLEENKISFQKIKSQITRSEAESIIDAEHPDIIVTGTSGGNTEQELRNAAYQRKIKSVVVLDFWKDYSRRWMYSSYAIDKIPDKVCVMDEITKKEMITENFPEANIIVTGHPYLDKIFNNNDDELNASTDNKRQRNKYLFLSQPLEIIGVRDYKIHPFKTLLNALKKLADIRNEKIQLTIKLHPVEEHSEELCYLAEAYNSDMFEISFADKTGQLKELIRKSGTVAGYNTIAMFESRALNKRTVSLTAGPVKDSLLCAMKEAGIETVETNSDKIFDLLNKKNTKVRSNSVFKGGVERCLRVIRNELSVN
ncbi:MAG: hypothetical protein IPL53_10045 [Ignavibacteria bacterium]|nr:hypothetical protein [Ignavibacteria bacterium]